MKRGSSPWTTAADLRSQVGRLWDRGDLGRSVIDRVIDRPSELVFPYRLRLRTPSSAELSARFDDVRAWIDGLAGGVGGGGGGGVPGVRIEQRTVNHRILGTNQVPASAWVDSLDDALAAAGRQDEAETLARMATTARERRPGTVAVLRQRPTARLELAVVWDRLLDLVDWLEANPAPGIYLRQVDLPGVDTKLIETNRAVLAELIDAALPEAAVDPEAAGIRGFERRYGFRSKPNLVRFRILDPGRQLPGLAPAGAPGRPGSADVTVDAATFAALEPDVETVYLVENEIDFLAFPEREGAMVVWVAGFGTERLAAARWLGEPVLLYWGDIDTHGFAILDELRRRFPQVQSFLMDRATLEAHRDLWVTEPRPERRDLPRLRPDEAELYDDLRHDRLGRQVRLEQERVGYHHLLAALDSANSTGASGGAR